MDSVDLAGGGGQRVAADELNRLREFRGLVYRCLGRRADELFELTDALLCAEGPVKSLVGLCRASEHRRGHAALYDVLSESEPTSWTAILDAVRLRPTEDRDRQDTPGQHVIARQVRHSGHSSSPSSGHFQSAGSSRVTGAKQRARPAMSPAPLTACSGPTGMSTHSSDQGRGRTASVPTVHRPWSPEPR